MTNIRVTKTSLLAIALVSCMFLTACPAWAPTLMNQIVIGTIGAINLAAAINHTTPDQSIISKVQAIGNGFVSAYNEWEAAAPNLKPGAWAKVQEVMKLAQADIPPILTSLNVSPTYLAVANFVIGEVLSLANTINGTPAMMATSKGAIHVSTSEQGRARNFKTGYNQRMVAAGHPEFRIK
jgi:hypothetical protein